MTFNGGQNGQQFDLHTFLITLKGARCTEIQNNL